MNKMLKMTGMIALTGGITLALTTAAPSEQPGAAGATLRLVQITPSGQTPAEFSLNLESSPEDASLVAVRLTWIDGTGDITAFGEGNWDGDVKSISPGLDSDPGTQDGRAFRNYSEFVIASPPVSMGSIANFTFDLQSPTSIRIEQDGNNPFLTNGEGMTIPVDQLIGLNLFPGNNDPQLSVANRLLGQGTANQLDPSIFDFNFDDVIDAGDLVAAQD